MIKWVSEATPWAPEIAITQYICHFIGSYITRYLSQEKKWFSTIHLKVLKMTAWITFRVQWQSTACQHMEHSSQKKFENKMLF
jgi:hypothetical protein